LDKHNIIIFREFNSNSTSETIEILDMKNVQYQSNVQEKHLMSCQNCESFNGNQNHDNSDQSFYDNDVHDNDVHANGVHCVEELIGGNENNMLFFCELKDQLETLKLEGLIHYNEIKQHIRQKENDIKDYKVYIGFTTDEKIISFLLIVLFIYAFHFNLRLKTFNLTGWQAKIVCNSTHIHKHKLLFLHIVPPYLYC